ncbi:MAG: hypothetical protein JWN04_1080 [Myxococcaceae bacterium]|nr:hypothetical protein [Myxococcaceae bacterium]
MPDPSDGSFRGSLQIRYDLHPDGKLTVWYHFDNEREVGPVELARADADELGALLEKASALLNRSPSMAAPAFDPADPLDDEPARTHTDPSALRRLRRP